VSGSTVPQWLERKLAGPLYERHNHRHPSIGVLSVGGFSHNSAATALGPSKSLALGLSNRLSNVGASMRHWG